MSFGDVQATWAATVCSALRKSGVQHVVVSPGSRSTPLVLALSDSGMTAHAVVDERAAAFFALGIARVRREPVALVCTSGSAGAHYLPAIIEAFETGHTLVALTADRPAELHRLGASQTTEQTALFGRHVVWAGVLGMASDEPGRLAACSSQVTQAVQNGRSARGPVHINVPMRKPFEPTRATDALPPPVLPPVVGGHSLMPSKDALFDAAGIVAEAREGWVIAGPCALDDDAVEVVRQFCFRSGYLLLAEHGSNLRDGQTETRRGKPFRRADGFEIALESLDAEALIPDVVVQLGRSPIHKGLAEALAARRGTFEHLLLTEDRWHDASRSVSRVLMGPVGDTLAALHDGLPKDSQSDETPKSDALCDRCEACWAHVFATLLEVEDQATEPGLVRAVAAQLPDGGSLFVGNSQPIRDLGHFCEALPANVGVLTQRGVAGIDGNIAGVLGASSVARGPVTALLGDVTFLHDVGSLAMAATVSNTTVIVVVNNAGGRIFDQLPIAAATITPATYSTFWTTPTSRSLSEIAAGFGVQSCAVDSLSAYARAATEAYARPGVSVIEVTVDPEVSATVRRTARRCHGETA